MWCGASLYLFICHLYTSGKASVQMSKVCWAPVAAPGILATREADIRRTVVQGQPRQKQFVRLYLANTLYLATQTKIWWNGSRSGRVPAQQAWGPKFKPEYCKKKKKKQSCFLIVGFQEFLKLCILDIRHLSVMYVTKIFSQWWFSFSFFVWG
jgi:hypothetical protein